MAASLTILIPTYRRPFNLANLLNSLTQILLKLGRLDVSILVSDNQSGDDTEAVAKAFSCKFQNVSYHRHGEHYGTGEENLFHALSQVTTDYVWFFSDDDLPDIAGVERVLLAIGKGDYDFIQLNARYVDSAGNVIVVELVDDVRGPYYETTIDRLVASHGWLHLSALFSASVMRTELIRGVNLQKYIDISPIYAHVAAYLEAFAGRPSLFIAIPSVSYLYGLDFEEGGLWKFHELAKRRGSFFSYFWSLGLVRLVSELERIGAVEPGYLLRIVEVTHHSKFTLADHTLMIVCDQLLYAVGNPDDLRTMNTRDIDEIALYYCSAEQRYVDIFCRIQRVAGLLKSFRPAPDDSDNPFTDALTSIGAEPMKRISVIVDDWASQELNKLKDQIMTRDADLTPAGEYRGYKMFSTGLEYIAQNSAVLIDRLTVLGPRESKPDIISAPSTKALKASIDQEFEKGTPTRVLLTLNTTE